MKITDIASVKNVTDNIKVNSSSNVKFSSFLSETPNVNKAAPANSIFALNPVFMLEVEELERKKRAKEMAKEALNTMKNLQLGILKGDIEQQDLEQLKSSVENLRERFNDKELNDILDELETRAAVELAKRAR